MHVTLSDAVLAGWRYAVTSPQSCRQVALLQIAILKA